MEGCLARVQHEFQPLRVSLEVCPDDDSACAAIRLYSGLGFKLHISETVAHRAWVDGATEPDYGNAVTRHRLEFVRWFRRVQV